MYATIPDQGRNLNLCTEAKEIAATGGQQTQIFPVRQVFVAHKVSKRACRKHNLPGLLLQSQSGQVSLLLAFVAVCNA